MSYKLSSPGWFSEVNGVKVERVPLSWSMVEQAGDFYAHHGVEFHVQAGPGRDISGTQNDRGYPIANFNVDDLGVVRQYMDARLAAWHGDSVSHYAYGIEHTGDAIHALPLKQLNSSAALCAALVEWTEAAFGETIPLEKVSRVSLANYQTVRGFWDHNDVDNGPLNENGHTDHLIGRSWAKQLEKIASYLRAPNPAPKFGGVLLQRGVDHADVITWKRRMASKGLFSRTDNGDGPHYGPAIERATVEFQRRRNLEDDGVVGPKTWNAAWGN